MLIHAVRSARAVKGVSHSMHKRCIYGRCWISNTSYAKTLSVLCVVFLRVTLAVS